MRTSQKHWQTESTCECCDEVEGDVVVVVVVSVVDVEVDDIGAPLEEEEDGAVMTSFSTFLRQSTNKQKVQEHHRFRSIISFFFLKFVF